MTTDELRKASMAVYLATDEPVAKDISEKFIWAADVIDECESMFWKTAQAPGKIRLWLVKKIFPEFSQMVESFRDRLYLGPEIGA